MQVNYKSLSFLGYPKYRVGEDGSVWRWVESQKIWKKRSFGRGSISNGYVRVTLCCNGRSKRFYVHQLVLLAFVGPCPDGNECRHRNGRKLDNFLDNLCWGTPKQNGEDKVRHGNSLRGCKHPLYNVGLRGEQNPQSVLTRSDVKTMKRLYQKYNRGGWTLKKLAERFRVTQQAVHNAITGKTWSHL